MKNLKSTLAATMTVLISIGLIILYNDVHFASPRVYESLWKGGILLVEVLSVATVVAVMMGYKTSKTHLVTSFIAFFAVALPALNTLSHLNMTIKLAVIGLIFINKMVIDLAFKFITK